MGGHSVHLRKTVLMWLWEVVSRLQWVAEGMEET